MNQLQLKRLLITVINKIFTFDLSKKALHPVDNIESDLIPSDLIKNIFITERLELIKLQLQQLSNLDPNTAITIDEIKIIQNIIQDYWTASKNTEFEYANNINILPTIVIFNLAFIITKYFELQNTPTNIITQLTPGINKRYHKTLWDDQYEGYFFWDLLCNHDSSQLLDINDIMTLGCQPDVFSENILYSFCEPNTRSDNNFIKPADFKLLAQHGNLAKYIEKFFAKSCNYQELLEKISTLEQGLIQGSTRHEGREFSAGGSANIAIVNFIEYFNSLPETTQAHINKLTNEKNKTFAGIFKRLYRSPEEVRAQEQRLDRQSRYDGEYELAVNTCVEITAGFLHDIVMHNQSRQDENLITTLTNLQDQYNQCLQTQIFDFFENLFEFDKKVLNYFFEDILKNSELFENFSKLNFIGKLPYQKIKWLEYFFSTYNNHSKYHNELRQIIMLLSIDAISNFNIISTNLLHYFYLKRDKNILSFLLSKNCFDYKLFNNELTDLITSERWHGVQQLITLIDKENINDVFDYKNWHEVINDCYSSKEYELIAILLNFNSDINLEISFSYDYEYRPLMYYYIENKNFDLLHKLLFCDKIILSNQDINKILAMLAELDNPQLWLDFSNTPAFINFAAKFFDSANFENIDINRIYITAILAKNNKINSYTKLKYIFEQQDLNLLFIFAKATNNFTGFTISELTELLSFIQQDGNPAFIKTFKEHYKINTQYDETALQPMFMKLARYNRHDLLDLVDSIFRNNSKKFFSDINSQTKLILNNIFNYAVTYNSWIFLAKFLKLYPVIESINITSIINYIEAKIKSGKEDDIITMLNFFNTDITITILTAASNFDYITWNTLLIICKPCMIAYYQEETDIVLAKMLLQELNKNVETFCDQTEILPKFLTKFFKVSANISANTITIDLNLATLYLLPNIIRAKLAPNANIIINNHKILYKFFVNFNFFNNQSDSEFEFYRNILLNNNFSTPEEFFCSLKTSGKLEYSEKHLAKLSKLLLKYCDTTDNKPFYKAWKKSLGKNLNKASKKISPQDITNSLFILKYTSSQVKQNIEQRPLDDFEPHALLICMTQSDTTLQHYKNKELKKTSELQQLQLPLLVLSLFTVKQNNALLPGFIKQQYVG